jgi:hypothetical protein
MDELDYADDGVLPEPGLSETVRVKMSAARVGVFLWRRLLPAGIVSIGLHLFLLPFVLTMTVVFADGFFAPANEEWSLGRQDQGNGLTCDLVVERDFLVGQIEEYVPQPGHYTNRRPQYIPPSPDYPLERELAYMQQQSTKVPQQPPEPVPSDGAAPGSEKDESPIAEAAEMMQKLTAILMTVVDEKTAEAAKPVITKWYAELDDFERRTKWYSLTSKQQADYWAKMWIKNRTVIAALDKEIARVQIAGPAALEVETPRGPQMIPRYKKPENLN